MAVRVLYDGGDHQLWEIRALYLNYIKDDYAIQQTSCELKQNILNRTINILYTSISYQTRPIITQQKYRDQLANFVW